MTGRGDRPRADRTGGVRVLVPPARGRRGFTRDRRTFAVLVRGIDRTRRDAGAIIGERVRGTIDATPGDLLLVYGEDRAPYTGELRGHCADLYRVERYGPPYPVERATVERPWVPAMLDAIDRARRLPPRRRARDVVPLTRPRGVAVVLAALVLLAGAIGSTPNANADVRDTAAWSVELVPGEWATLPAYVCGGALPSNREAWSARTGRRVGDARLWAGTRPARIVGSSYRGPVLAYVWCERDEAADQAAARWAMVKLALAARSRRGDT